jgi:hypothetical protein
LNVSLFPTVFGLLLQFFQTTVQIPRFFSVEFVVSPYLSAVLNFSDSINKNIEKNLLPNGLSAEKMLIMVSAVRKTLNLKILNLT